VCGRDSSFVFSSGGQFPALAIAAYERGQLLGRMQIWPETSQSQVLTGRQGRLFSPRFHFYITLSSVVNMIAGGSWKIHQLDNRRKRRVPIMFGEISLLFANYFPPSKPQHCTVSNTHSHSLSLHHHQHSSLSDSKSSHLSTDNWLCSTGLEILQNFAKFCRL